ncbi:MAG: hypothetical protein WKG32_18310 [Gemmatimonadaceae bacterium]
MSTVRKRAVVDVVIKVGGGLLAQPGTFDRVASTLGRVRRTARTLVVPGGGPFADAVRAAGRCTALADDPAHWMAILAMDQYAHLLASRVRGARLVSGSTAIRAALAEGWLPVLAPFRWLRRADPLPHSWDATSDSIAAWVAGVLGARRLILIKPAQLDLALAVDPHFARALPEQVRPIVLGAGNLRRLGALLRDRREVAGE